MNTEMEIDMTKEIATQIIKDFFIKTKNEEAFIITEEFKNAELYLGRLEVKNIYYSMIRDGLI